MPDVIQERARIAPKVRDLTVFHDDEILDEAALALLALRTRVRILSQLGDLLEFLAAKCFHGILQ